MGRCEDLVCQLLFQGFGVGGRGLAGVAVADVGRGPAVHHGAVLEKGGSRREWLPRLDGDEHVVGRIAAVHRSEERLSVGIVVAAKKGDLSGIGEVKIESAEPVAESKGMSAHAVTQR